MRTAGCLLKERPSKVTARAGLQSTSLCHSSGKDGPTESQPQFTAASFAFLHREDTPAPQAFLLWRKRPYEGASPRDTEVCTVPSLPAIWGHGGSGNKVTFQRFLVQQRKASAAISWAQVGSMAPAPHCSLSLLFFPAVPCCPLLSPATNSSSRTHLSSGCCPSSSLHYWDAAFIMATCLVSPTFSLWLITCHMVGMLQTLDHL